MESETQSLTQSHVFSSPTLRSRTLTFRTSSLERSLTTQKDLRALINNALVAHQSSNNSTNQLPKRNLSGYLAPQLQDTMCINECKQKKEGQLKAMLVEKDTSRSGQSTLREKRLWDAKVYRSFHSRESSNSLERTTHNSKQSVGCSLVSKSQLVQLISPEATHKKKEINSSLLGHIPTLAVQDSSSISLDTNSKDGDSTCRAIKNTHLLATSQNFEKVPTARDDSKEIDEWRNYYSNAADPAFASKIQSVARRRRIGSASLESQDRRGEKNKSFNMMPSYAEFIKKNFDESIIERIDTFGTFAFTSVEKEENKGIPTFINETKNKKESKGSMGVIDLWSSKLISELANRVGFVKEKKIIEKFAFYKSREKKDTNYNNKKPEFVILNRKNENIYKDILVRKEFTRSHKKNEDMGLLSSIQRQMPLKGKSYYKAREKSTETPRTKNDLTEIKGGFADIMSSLSKFAEKNQDDYVKLLERSASDRKLPKERVRSVKKIERIRKL